MPPPGIICYSINLDCFIDKILLARSCIIAGMGGGELKTDPGKGFESR